MKKGKRLLALVVAVSLLVGLAPISSTSYAEGTATEPTLNETLKYQDSFNGSWNSSIWDYSTEGQKKYYGDLVDRNGDGDGEASLGWNSYTSDSGRMPSKGLEKDVHMKATVCVTAPSASSTYSQYHLLFARASNGAGAGSIAFGFETKPGASVMKSSLVIAKYNGGSMIQDKDILYRSDATYDHNKEYSLELFVVDMIVIAKCNGETIYAAVVPDITDGRGQFGILDKWATKAADDVTLNTSDSFVYSTHYTKNGYFDDFSLSAITYDGFKVNGPVIVNQTGVGVADITILSGGVEVGEVQDVSVSVADLQGKQCHLYEGNYNVTTILSGEQRTAAAERVFVVNDIQKTVTSMSDDRWDGNTVSSNPNFTVDGLGKATLTNKAYSILSMETDEQGEDKGYRDFYVEYTLNISGISSQRNWFYTRFNISERANTNTESTKSFSADILHDLRGTGGEPFYARLQQWTDKKTIGTYSNGTTEGDVQVGDSMTIGLLVYNDIIEYTLNGHVVGTYRYEEDATPAEGWFTLYNETGGDPTVVTVKDFIYVPLTEKALVDIEVDATSKVQYGEDFTPSVTTVYTWPNEKEAVTGGVTVTGFDNTKLGAQNVTVSYADIEKEVTVEVVNYESVVFEDFTDNPFSNTEAWASNSNMTVADGVATAPNSVTASAYIKETVSDGFVEVTIALDNPNDIWKDATTGTSMFPATLLCVKGTEELKVRFCVTKGADDTCTATVQTVITNTKGTHGAYQADHVSLNDFEWNKPYTIRLSFVGNYVETIVKGVGKAQATIPASLDMGGSKDKVGFLNEVINGRSAAAVTLDNLEVGRYTTYQVSTANATVKLPEYKDITDKTTSNQRNAFVAGDEVVVTVTPEEGKQLAAAGGLSYKIGDVTYVVDDRDGNPGENTEISNQFVLKMPASNITLEAKYVDATAANMGVRSVSIREKSDGVKSGIRFSHRAYNEYTTTEGDTYTLTEVGTLVFKQGIEVTNDVLNSCYTSGTYTESETTYGKKVKATRAQDFCDAYIDWGLVLTYEEGSELFDTQYKAYSYAVYKNAEGKPEVVFSEGSTPYSYNDVATLVGYTTR